MDFYSIWPVFIEIVIIFTVAWLPLFRKADEPPSSAPTRRISTLDGLRGFLALAVFYHHTSIYHRYMTDGIWTYPPSVFMTNLGPVGVGLFFMITGFLFWSKLLNLNRKFDWLALYIDRVFRIVPLYIVTILAMLLIVGVDTHFHRLEPLLKITKEVSRWAMAGVLDGYNVNADPRSGLITAGVTWTLRYEWAFYAALIVLAAISPKQWMRLTLPIFGILLGLMLIDWTSQSPNTSTKGAVLLFSLGMGTASLRKLRPNLQIPDLLASGLIVFLLLVAVFWPSLATTSVPTIMLGCAFYLIATGGSIFGLLNTKAARRLGDISFGIYLLQGIVLTSVFSIPSLRNTALASPLGHWLLMLLAGLILVGLAMLTHVIVERPFIEIGHLLHAPVRRRIGLSVREVAAPVG